MGSRAGWSLAGIGLAGACAVVCCSAPLLLVALPGLSLVVGWAMDMAEAGLVAATILAVLAGAGMLLRRRRQGTCSHGAGCADGCCVSLSSSTAKLHWPGQQPETLD